MYVMGRWAESFAFLPLMLVFWAIEKFGKMQERKYFLLGGLFLAFLILSHNVVAMLMVPIVLIYGLYNGYENYKSLITSIILGLGLSAFFWIPALAETQYTLQGQRPVYDFRQNFPSLKSYLYYPWGYGFSLAGEPNGVSPMVGLGQLAAVGLGLLVIPAKAGIYKKISIDSGSTAGMTRILVFGLVGVGAAFFMMNSASVPVWEKLPLIKAVQFPGRLNVVLLTMIAITAAAGLQLLAGNRKIQVGAVSVLSFLSLYSFFSFRRSSREPAKPKKRRSD
jgi:membrane protein implicated in regulation of membrane protease activity